METRLISSTGATAPSAAPGGDRAEPPVSADGWSAVLAGSSEGVVVCDRQSVVRAANPAARALLPGLVEGQVEIGRAHV